MRGTLLVCALALAASVASVEARSGWSVAERSDPNAELELLVGLKRDERKLEQLEEAFWAVSNPFGPRWSKHLSAKEMKALTAPKPRAVAVVKSWLSSCARSVELLQSGDWIRAVATVECAESLLGAEYALWTRDGVPASKRGPFDAAHRLAPGTSLSLPAHVQPFVHLVEPTKHFPAPLRVRRSKRAKQLRGAAGLLGTNPTTIRTAYGLGGVEANNSFAGANVQQFTGFLGQYADPSSDLQSFFETYYPAGKGRKFSVVGPNQPNNAGDEASLDAQYIMAVGSNVTTQFWSTTGQRPYGNEPYLTWLTNLTALPDAQLPNTISTSYGDNEWQIEDAFADAVDIEFQKLGARGTSMMFASGDGGVAGGQAGACIGANGTTFVPTWPASSPYILSVGATDATYKKAASFSSGGFSNRYPAPAWQQAAIAAYKASATGLPTPYHYNATGAGFPDVSTVGVSFWIYCAGLDEPVDGTSCASPTFTGVVSLLNDARMAQGKRPLGPLNQLLYAHPEVLTDITAGSNPGCGTKGFPAAAGWDPVTGLGSPNFPAMLQLALSLP